DSSAHLKNETDRRQGRGTTAANVPSGRRGMKTEEPGTLPKTLAGVVCRQWVRCGKRNCRCASGRLHGPYHYRFWRQGGRLRKAYIRPADLDRVREACLARRREKGDLRSAWEQWRQIVTLLREVEVQ